MGVTPWKHVRLIIVIARMAMIVMVIVSMIGAMAMIKVCAMLASGGKMMTRRLARKAAAVIPQLPGSANEAKPLDPKQPRTQQTISA